MLGQERVLTDDDPSEVARDHARHEVADGAPRAHESRPDDAGVREHLDDLDAAGILPELARGAVPPHGDVGDLHHANRGRSPSTMTRQSTRLWLRS
jgi:hypothetical protein